MKKFGFVLVLMGVLLLSAAVRWGGSWLDFRTSAMDIREEASVSEVNAVEIKGGTVDVKIVRGTGDRITARLHGAVNDSRKGDYKLEKTVNSGLLTFHVEAEHNWHIGFNRSPELEVELPEKTYDKLAVSLSTGDLEMDRVEAKQVEVHTTTGDIRLEEVKAAKLYTGATTGDIYMRSVAGELEAKATTGDVVLERIEMGSGVRVNTTTGDIKVGLASVPAAMRAELTTKTGDTKWNVSGPEMKFEAKSEKRTVGTIGSGGPLLQLAASTGDVQVSN